MMGHIKKGGEGSVVLPWRFTGAQLYTSITSKPTWCSQHKIATRNYDAPPDAVNNTNTTIHSSIGEIEIDFASNHKRLGCINNTIKKKTHKLRYRSSSKYGTTPLTHRLNLIQTETLYRRGVCQHFGILVP